jgi:hypothetical protein
MFNSSIYLIILKSDSGLSTLHFLVQQSVMHMDSSEFPFAITDLQLEPRESSPRKPITYKKEKQANRGANYR